MTNEARKMTFQEFQQSRVWSNDLGASLSFMTFEDEPKAQGNVYLETLYIDKVADHWPEGVRREGAWSLEIANQHWATNDLTMLEARLYDYAVHEGYIKRSEISDQEIATAIRMSDLDNACAFLQVLMGIEDGGLAGAFFASFDWVNASQAERENMIRRWLDAENHTAEARLIVADKIRHIYDPHSHSHVMVAHPKMPAEHQHVEWAWAGTHEIVLHMGERVWIAGCYAHEGHADVKRVREHSEDEGGGYSPDGSCILSIPADWCSYYSHVEAEGIELCREADERLLRYAR